MLGSQKKFFFFLFLSSFPLTAFSAKKEGKEKPPAKITAPVTRSSIKRKKLKNPVQTGQKTWVGDKEGPIREPLVELNSNGKLTPQKSNPPKKAYEPEHGFYDVYEDLYRKYLKRFASPLNEQQGSPFARRTKAFVIIVNFLFHGKKIISDYSSPSIKRTLLSEPYYADSEEMIAGEGRLYLTKRYYRGLLNAHGRNLLKDVFNFLKEELANPNASQKETYSDTFLKTLKNLKNYSAFKRSFQKETRMEGPKPRTVNIDHIVPKRDLGANTVKNAAVISRKLNTKKSDHTPGPLLRGAPKELLPSERLAIMLF